jgi:hypothetical protein
MDEEDDENDEIVEGEDDTDEKGAEEDADDIGELWNDGDCELWKAGGMNISPTSAVEDEKDIKEGEEVDKYVDGKVC